MALHNEASHKVAEKLCDRVILVLYHHQLVINFIYT